MRSAIAVAVVVSWLMSPTSMAQSPDPPGGSSSSAPGAADAAGLVAAGKTAFAAGDHVAAHRLFQAATAADPTHPTALYNAALAARKAGLLVEAGEAYRALLQRTPDDLDAIYGLAEVERGLGHVDSARALYERFIAGEQRPARAALRDRAIAAFEGLPPPTAPTTAPPPGPPLASPARRQEAEAHFGAGQALSARGQHAEAAAAYLAAVERDPARVDALLRAGLSFRRAGRLDEAVAAYDRAVAHERATAEQRLDGTYGLGETWRLRGDVDRALGHFRRYVDGEPRPGEVRFVERARAAIVELEARAQAARQAPGAPPAFVADAFFADAFFGDGAVVDALLLDAAARRAAGDESGAAALLARARALAPDDPRVAPPPVPRCDVERLLGRGEAALAKQDSPGARLAFERALACDPARSAPLWGLSRAADLVGDRVAGRHHARRYLEARGPDRDAATARAAFWRSEQP